MQSLRDKNNKKNTRTKIITTVLVFLFLILVSGAVFPVFGKAFRVMVSPLWKLENNISQNTTNFFAGFHSKQSLETQNQNLQAELADAQARLIAEQTITNQLTDLEATFGRKISANMVLGTILVKPNRSLYDTVVIDIGTDQGIAVSNVVYASGNIPIGVITQAGASTSTVTLFSTSGQTITGRIDGLNIDVSLVGRGGGNFEIQVPRDVTLTPNTNVLLPGLLPQVIAVVAKSITDPRDPYQTFLLTSPVNINQLNWVEVEK